MPKALSMAFLDMAVLIGPLLARASAKAAAATPRIKWKHRIHGMNLSSYSPPADLNYTCFVLLSTQRSASSFLTGKLMSHPNIRMLGEVLDDNEPLVSSRLDDRWTLASRDADRTAFMRDVYEGPAPPTVRARGIKAFSSQMTEDELLALTRPKHVLKIVLRRQDTLAQYASQVRMSETGHAGRQTMVSDEYRVTLDRAAYAEFVAEYEAWWAYLAALSKEHPESWLWISTERFLASPYTMASIYAHLKVPLLNTSIEYDPYIAGSLEDHIVNWDELQDCQVVADDRW
mmetsp:Transcript_4461/g.18139  ORF Transcript_4461/g.18139 Transcript_4461/m.18139 type:complete len:288 (-) Transcript_4461:1899-2762(-)